MTTDAFKFKMADDFGDIIIEEKGNMSTNVRMIAWGDNDNYKLDIRKWYYKDGEEKCGRGITLSDEAADELVNALTDKGYGDTKTLLSALRKREDFKDAVLNSGKEDEEAEDEYYDPSCLLGGECCE